jgi:hypothetical protein
MGMNIKAFNCYGFQVSSDKDKEACGIFLEYLDNKPSSFNVFVYQFGWDVDVINYVIGCNAQFTEDNPEDAVNVNFSLNKKKAKEELKQFCNTYGFEYKEPSWLLCVEYCV